MRRAGKLHAVAVAVAGRCGLPVETCQSLLGAGWAYTERPHEGPRWERPPAAKRQTSGGVEEWIRRMIFDGESALDAYGQKPQGVSSEARNG